MTTPNLDELMAQARTGAAGRPTLFTPEVAKARGTEQRRRTAAAAAVAKTALCQLHPDDYQCLYRQALAKLDGPLPGDEATP